MATKTFEELKQLAIQIRDEKTNKQNTATRVGTAMLEHINKLEQDYYDKTQTDEELKERDDKLTELENNIGGFDNWKEGFYYPIVNPGSTFAGKLYESIAWKTLCIEGIPANSIIQLHNISYGEATQGAIVCDMWDKVIDIVDAKPDGIVEKIYEEPIKLYISTLVDNESSKVIIYDKDKIDEFKNSIINYSVFPFIGKYYYSKNWEVGQTFNPIPSGNSSVYNSFLYLLPSGKTVNIYKVKKGIDTPYFIVADAITLEILELLDIDSVKTYTSEKDVYIAFSTNLIGQVSLCDTESSIVSNFSNILILNKCVEKNSISISDLFNTWKDGNSSINVIQKTTGYYNGTNGTINSHELCYLSQAIQVSEGDSLLIFSNANSSQFVYFEANSDGSIKVGTNFYSKGWVQSGQFKNEFHAYFIKVPKDVEFIGVAWNKADGALGKVFVSKINDTLLKVLDKEIYATYLLNNHVAKRRYINLQGAGEYISNWCILDYCSLPKDNKLLFSNNLKSIYINEGIGYILAWYDENYDFIDGINSDGFVDYDKFCYPKEIPENAKYFSISIPNAGNEYFLYSRDTDNLFSFVNVKENISWNKGHYIKSSGYLDSSPNWAITEPIRISNKFNYIISLNAINGEALPCYACIYEDKEMTKVVKTFSTETSSGVSKIYLLLKGDTFPSEGKYIVFCTRTDGLNESTSESYVGLEFKVDSILGKSINLDNETNAISYVDEKIPIVLPKYIDIPIGRQTDIFLDGIVAVPNDVKRNPMKITGGLRGETTTIDDNQIRISMSEEKELNVIFSIYNDLALNSINNEKTLTLRAIPKNVGNGEDEVNICIAGDSLIDGTAAPCEAYKLLNEDADFVINQIGTRTANFSSQQYKHEGRGSWSWETYINPRYETEQYAGKTNAFMIDGELNFQKYMQNNFPDLSRKEIDIFIMSLGTNDVTQGYSIPNENRINVIINAAKNFIDALLSEDRGFPNCKIAIGLPGTGAPVFVTTQTSSNVFRLAILKLNQAYIDTFDNGKYHPNVTCVMHGAYIDRYDGYQHEEVAVNDYTTRKVRRWTNEVHPLQVGYQQWGRGYYGKLRAFLNSKL